MNQEDRDRMARLYTCMARLPYPNRNRTLGPADLSEFFANIEKLQPQFLDAIMAISRVDDLRPHPQPVQQERAGRGQEPRRSHGRHRSEGERVEEEAGVLHRVHHRKHGPDKEGTMINEKTVKILEEATRLLHFRDRLNRAAYNLSVPSSFEIRTYDPNKALTMIVERASTASVCAAPDKATDVDLRARLAEALRNAAAAAHCSADKLLKELRECDIPVQENEP